MEIMFLFGWIRSGRGKNKQKNLLADNEENPGLFTSSLSVNSVLPKNIPNKFSQILFLSKFTFADFFKVNWISLIYDLIRHYWCDVVNQLSFQWSGFWKIFDYPGWMNVEWNVLKFERKQKKWRVQILVQSGLGRIRIELNTLKFPYRTNEIILHIYSCSHYGEFIDIVGSLCFISTQLGL